ncbi:MAG: ROK family transcriptional regulator [Actinobacteria bacterium]|nr:ROK family transcriptional regulator [Actinomycetota bacterium]MCG2799959.1 ROK family transcriptional regulator [Cellulomonas sp.]
MVRKAARSQASLRAANKALVLQTVQRWGGLTQVELAAATGLSPASVSTIVRDLFAAGVVETATTTRNGRRAQLVTVSRRLGLAVGIQFGQRHVHVQLSDFALHPIAEHVLPLPHDHQVDTGLDRATLLMADLLERVGASFEDVAGVGVAVPAPVEAGTSTLSIEGVMPGWAGVDIAQTLSKRIGRPVYVDNDANLGALAESVLGAGRDLRDVVYLRASYGTAVGVALAGAIHRGYAGIAGEIGHVLVDPQGRMCRCGNRGCLDTVVGGAALVESVRPVLGPLTLRDVVQRANEGDPACTRVVADAGAQIGGVLAVVSLVVNPQVVLVGGELAETGEVFLGPLRERIGRRVPANNVAPLQVLPAELGPRAEVMGAMLLALQATDVSVPAVLDLPVEVS